MNLWLDLRFIENFRYQESITIEESRFIKKLDFVLGFILRVDEKALFNNVTHEEFHTRTYWQFIDGNKIASAEDEDIQRNGTTTRTSSMDYESNDMMTNPEG